MESVGEHTSDGAVLSAALVTAEVEAEGASVGPRLDLSLRFAGPSLRALLHYEREMVRLLGISHDRRTPDQSTINIWLREQISRIGSVHAAAIQNRHAV